MLVLLKLDIVIFIFILIETGNVFRTQLNIYDIAVSCFAKKLIVDVRLGSKYTSGSMNYILTVLQIQHEVAIFLL